MPWELTGNGGTNPGANFLGTTDNEPLSIRTNGGERIHLDIAGNVGIGLTDPRTQLHVLGRISTGLDFSSSGAITFFPPDGFAWFHIDNGPVGGRPIGRLRLSHGVNPGANELMTLVQNGNVGIGLADPRTQLHVQGRISTGLDFSSAGAITFFPPDGFAWFHIDNGPAGGRPLGRLRFSYGGSPGEHEIMSLQQDGNIVVNGDIQLTGADCAEEFPTSAAAAAEPGMVMVINDAGELEPSEIPYNHRVAGVVAGAGDYHPGLILDKRDSSMGRVAIGLVGKAFCKVDARYGSINVGDLLTTSATRGHAMKASDTARAFGAVLGKALGALDAGQGLLPVLIALH